MLMPQQSFRINALLLITLLLACPGCQESPTEPAEPGASADRTSKLRTIEDLLAEGAVPLSTEEIRDLLIGRSLRLTDLQSGEKFEVFFGRDGKRTVLETTSSALLKSETPEAVSFQIRDGKVWSLSADGSESKGSIYRLRDRYFAVLEEQGGIVGYEMVGSIEGRMTIASLLAGGGRPLTTEELEAYLIGRTITVNHLVGGEVFEISYSRDGVRTVMVPGEEEVATSHYHIADGKLQIDEDGYQFYARLYRLGDRVYGARSVEEGFVSYEILSSRAN